MKSKTLTISMVIGIIITIMLSNFATFAKDYQSIQDDVLRLHIMANSDSQADQKLKMAIRNSIIKLDQQLFKDIKENQKDDEFIHDKLEIIRQTALNTIHLMGYSYNVKVELVDMYFTARDYDKYTMPAGKYHAVRVIIGEGKGKNWWCVLYPPLCLPAVTEDGEKNTKTEELFTKQQFEIISKNKKYKFKLKSYEIFLELKKLITD